MTRRLRIEWQQGSKVTGLLTGAGEGSLGILLAHGAGAGQRHPFMSGLRSLLAGAGVPTLTFDYGYMEAGRKAPDRLNRLIECHRAVYERMSERFDRVVVAGKSMGGRVGSHMAAEMGDVERIIFLGYPLVPIGKSEPRSTDHLEQLGNPMLFIQGERDALAPLSLIGDLVSRLPDARLETIPQGDHSFRVPKRTGLDEVAVLERIASWMVEFATAD